MQQCISSRDHGATLNIAYDELWPPPLCIVNTHIQTIMGLPCFSPPSLSSCYLHVCPPQCLNSIKVTVGTQQATSEGSKKWKLLISCIYSNDMKDLKTGVQLCWKRGKTWTNPKPDPQGSREIRSLNETKQERVERLRWQEQKRSTVAAEHSTVSIKAPSNESGSLF